MTKQCAGVRPQAASREDAAAPRKHTLSRRQFIQAAVTAAVLAGCRANRPTAAPEPTSASASLPPTATATTTATPGATATATALPSPTATSAPATAATATLQPTQTAAPTEPARALARVAIAQAAGYDRALIRQQMRTLLDGIGGLKDVIHAGDRVAIKVNLTGGNHYTPPAGLSTIESYMTHPEVVRALGELVRDAGAREILIVEAVFDSDSFRAYGYVEVAQALNATLIDLNSPQPYADFVTQPVGPGWLIYENLILNRILTEVDAFISVSKMKSHCRCGVTHSMKNLIGLAPVQHYRLNPGDWWRSAMHGPDNETTRTRLPRVVIDLNRARPIHLALIDGIKTAGGGEVPCASFGPVQPGALIAARNPVAADAVATAIMGFDPTAVYPAVPFVNGDNHLNLAHELRMGTNRLEEIDVVGAAIADVRRQFAPCFSENG
jgi:uncharacterized protein (DUF362 family)